MEMVLKGIPVKKPSNSSILISNEQFSTKNIYQDENPTIDIRTPDTLNYNKEEYNINWKNDHLKTKNYKTSQNDK